MQFSPRLRRRQSIARGVTLVELVVVVAIIAILAIAFMAAYRTVRAQSVDGRATDFLDQLRRVMAVYSAQRGQFPVPSGITNNTANTGAVAYTALATEVRTVEADFPTSLVDSSVNLQDFTYYPSASGTFTAANGFTVIARAINGTGSYLCADASKVANLGSSSAPATPGRSCQ